MQRWPAEVSGWEKIKLTSNDCTLELRVSVSSKICAPSLMSTGTAHLKGRDKTKLFYEKLFVNANFYDKVFF
jgi:hypothetical protein